MIQPKNDYILIIAILIYSNYSLKIFKSQEFILVN
jgi:hypothetical protein